MPKHGGYDSKNAETRNTNALYMHDHSKEGASTLKDVQLDQAQSLVVALLYSAPLNGCYAGRCLKDDVVFDLDPATAARLDSHQDYSACCLLDRASRLRYVTAVVYRPTLGLLQNCPALPCPPVDLS